MTIYYKKLKTEKIVNLFSVNAVKTVVNGRNTVFEFQLPYNFNTFSKNVEMNVVAVSYEVGDISDDNNIFVFRCLEVNTEDVYDTTTGLGPVIYHTRGFSRDNDMSLPIFKMTLPINKLTISITNDPSSRDNGVHLGDFFIMTLVFKDYEIEEVNPQSMPIVEPYSHIPQMKIKY